MTRFFRIADISLQINLPDITNLIPPSLLPFESKTTLQSSPDINIDVNLSQPPAVATIQIIDDSTNDIGHSTLHTTADGYLLRLNNRHTLLANPTFNRAAIFLDPDSDAPLYQPLNSLLRIAFSQAALLHGAISVHASAVETSADKAAIFLGASGTGKSTHARLWTETFDDASLLNDDNPIIKLDQTTSTPYIYGSPWSGKTPCYIPRRQPLAAIIRLRQAPLNRFTRLSDIEAFVTVLPSCSAIKTDPTLHSAMIDTLTSLLPHVIVGLLDCLPDADAARLSRASAIQ